MKPRCSTPSLRPSILFFVALLFLAFPLTSHAQIGVYGNFTAGTSGRITFSTAGPRPGNVYNTSWLYGGTGGFYAEMPLPGFALGLDLRGTYISGDKLNHWNAIGGPRVELRPEGFKPYGEILFGIGGYHDDLYSTSTRTTEYTLLAGVDKTIFRKHIDWRIAEFAFNSYFDNRNAGSKQLSTGIVFHLP
jgi:hypothetical protein